MGFEQMGSNVGDCLQFARSGAAVLAKTGATQGRNRLFGGRGGISSR